MTTAIVGTNVKVELQQTLGSAVQASAITLASPGVVTATAHGYANGDVVVATVTAGMVELDGQACRVANITTNTFELESLDTSAYSAVTAASTSFKSVTAFQTYSKSQSVTMPNPAPAKLDATTLIDKTKQYVYGLPDAPDGSITALYNPAGTAEALIKTATKNNTAMVARLTFAGGQKCIFNANWSGGSGFDLAQNQVAHATVVFTPIRDVQSYAT